MITILNDNPNPYVGTLFPEKREELRDQQLRDLDGWNTEQSRDLKWVEFWRRYDEREKPIIKKLLKPIKTKKARKK